MQKILFRNKDQSVKRGVLLKYGMIVCSIVLITIFLPKQPRFRYEYEKGKVWMHENLVSPYNFAILKTPAELELDRERILSTINPIYELAPAVGDQNISNFNNDFEEKWKAAGLDTLADNADVYKRTGDELLRSVYNRGVLSLNNRYQQGRTDYNFTLLEGRESRTLNTVNVFTIEKAWEFVENSLARRRTIDHNEWLANTLKDYIAINISFNETLTSRLEQDALASFSTTKGMVQRGELIIASGTTINADTYQKIESLRKVYEEEARLGGNSTLVVFGQFMIVALIVGLLLTFLFLFRRDIFDNTRLIALILIVITSMLLALSWAIQLKIPSLYYIPYCIVPIIIRILFDTRLALNIHLLMVLLAAFFVPNSFEFIFLQFTTGMVAIYSIKTLVKRQQFLVSSALILLTYIFAFLALVLIREGQFSNVTWGHLLPFIFSVLLTLLAYPLIYAFERFFGIVSDVTLIELSDSNSKLLRELSFKAPGTFQHSLQVANLAEAAIYKIGGNSLLVRVGALYHDVGKTFNPQFFIENQTKDYNPHDGLTAEQSAQTIISHVTKGIDLAKKHKLPEVIIDFIRTHHGTTRVEYFYQNYLKNFPEKSIDELLFRYPGPIPFSKETAVLMIADSVEAASRSLKEPTSESINQLVDKIVESKLSQNQLIRSNITLSDLTDISEIFKDMLKSIYHVRIDYDVSKKGRKVGSI